MGLIKNLTPHELRIIKADGSVLTLPPSGLVARREVTRVDCPQIDGINVASATFGLLVDLPSPRDGMVYVVSALTAQAVPQRRDVFMPGEALRDEHGRVVGCKGLACIIPWAVA